MKNTEHTARVARVAQPKPLQTLFVNGRQYSPSARDVFPMLRARLLGSRPVVGFTAEVFHADGSRTESQPIFGKPTFRNVIDENGAHV